jgi:hypothetical protein
MSQPKVDVFAGSVIRKTKYRRTYIKSILDSYEYLIDYSTEDTLAQNIRKRKPSRPIKELKKKPIMLISLPKITLVIQLPAVEKN